MTQQGTLGKITHDVLEMASRSETMFANAIDSLMNLDTELALSVIQSDDEVDLIDLQLETECLNLLSQNADRSDLSEIGTILKIITDIERVADLSADIAKCTLNIEGELGNASHVDMPMLASKAQQMLHLSLESFARKDASCTAKIDQLEQEVDRVFAQFREQIYQQMKADPDAIVALSNLLMAAANVERIADHALNICQRVGYLITGEVQTHAFRSA